MSLANALLSCTPSKIPAVGDNYGGGFFVGQLTIGGLVYNIIVAPKATGQSATALTYRTSTTVFAGNTSTNDGALIRDNMIAVGIANFPAQQYCTNLNIGGKTDWYLPTQDELELAYRVMKPSTAVNITTSGKNPSSIPPTTAFYTTAAPAQAPIALFRTGGAQAFNADYYNAATAGTAASQYLLKRFTTGADYSEGYAFSHIVRGFRRELAA